jgi:hypothetical protein
MTYELILKMGAVRWPCNEQHPHGTERLYEDLKFWTGIDECESYSADFQKAQPPRKRLRWMISVRLGNVSRMIGIISHESSAAAGIRAPSGATEDRGRNGKRERRASSYPGRARRRPMRGKWLS